MQKLFAIVLQAPNAEVEKRIDEAYPVRFKYTDTFHLVSVEPSIISQNVAEAVGIKGERRVEDSEGVVFKVSSAYSGYTQRTLWEWLSSMTGDR